MAQIKSLSESDAKRTLDSLGAKYEFWQGKWTITWGRRQWEVVELGGFKVEQIIQTIEKFKQEDQPKLGMGDVRIDRRPGGNWGVRGEDSGGSGGAIRHRSAFQIPTLKKSTIRSRKGLGLELDVAELVRRFLMQREGKAAKPPVGNEGIQGLPPGFSIENVGFQKWNILENGVVVGTSDSKRHAVDKANRIAVGQEPRKTKSLPIDEKGLKEKVQLIIDKLTERYGASQAMAIVTSGQAVGWAATVIGTVLTGVPTWVPGSSVWGMAPGIALAEAYRQFHSKSIKGITASRYMLADLVSDFRHFMERLRNYGIRVPSLSDEQIARTLEAAINESERMEFGGRTRGKSIETKGADELLRMWQAGPSHWTNDEITRNVNQLSNEDATKLGQSMFNDKDKYTRQQIRQAFEHRFESWNRIQFRSMTPLIKSGDTQSFINDFNRWWNNPTSQGVRELEQTFKQRLGQAEAAAVVRKLTGRDWYDEESIEDSWIEIRYGPMVGRMQGKKSIDEWQGRKLEEWDDRALREFIQSWGGLVPGKASREDLLKIVRRRIRFLESQGREVKASGKFLTRQQIKDMAKKKSIALPDERQDESWSCGAAAVVSVCRYFSIEPDTESEAIRELGSSPSDGTPPQSIVDVLESHGLATDARDWFDLDILNEKHLKKGHPVLCPIQMYGNPAEYEQAEGGHWVVLTGVWDNKVCLQDPVAGKVEMDVEEFKSRWHDKGADGNPYEQYGIACWKPAIDYPNVVYTDRWAIPMMKRSPFWARKSLGLTKAEGTCQQGERADLTGCTPASGEGGSGSESSSKPESKPNKNPTKRNIKKEKIKKGSFEMAKEMGLNVNSPQQIADLFGMPEEISSLEITPMPNKEEGDRVMIEAKGKGWSMTRFIEKRGNELVLKNNSLMIDPKHQGQGLGTKILSMQVEQATKMGIDRIEATAAGRPGSTMNGYYTWPRLGYDAKIPDKIKTKLPDQFKQAESILDLYSLPGGSEWWKENGEGSAVSFSLKDGSRSKKILGAYLEERSKRAA